MGIKQNSLTLCVEQHLPSALSLSVQVVSALGGQQKQWEQRTINGFGRTHMVHTGWVHEGIGLQ